MKGVHPSYALVELPIRLPLFLSLVLGLVLWAVLPQFPACPLVVPLRAPPGFCLLWGALGCMLPTMTEISLRIFKAKKICHHCPQSRYSPSFIKDRPRRHNNDTYLVKIQVTRSGPDICIRHRPMPQCASKSCVH